MAHRHLKPGAAARPPVARPLALAVQLLVAGGAATLGAWAPPAQAQGQGGATAQAVRGYDIPAGPLARVLTRFSREAGIYLAGAASATEGKTSPGLKGSHGVQEGLAVLLAGTGLEAFRQADGSYGLRPAPVAPVKEAAPTPHKPAEPLATSVLPTVQVTGQAEDDGATEGTGSYTTHRTSYGKGQSLKELPQTVTVMTHERIQDQGLKTINEVLEYTPGVTVEQSGSAVSSFNSRGFEITNFQVDGNSPLMAISSMQAYAGGLNTSQMDLAMFDSVEVLRGSDALYGTSGEPGGAINLVRKKPTKQFQIKGQTSAGSWSNYRGELDVSGPLTADGRVRGRLVGALEDRKYFYDVANSNKQLAYGIVEADITDGTMLTIGGDVLHQDSTNWRYGLPRYTNGQDIGLPRSTFFGTNDDRWDRRSTKQFLRIDQAIGADWTLGIEASRAQSKVRQTDPFWQGAIDPVTFSGLRQWVQRGIMNDRVETQKALDAVLKGSFHLLGREHKLTLGANTSQYKANTINYRRMGNGIQIPNIFDFDPADHPLNEPYTLFLEEEFLIKQKGIYGSLASRISDPLTLIAGGRMSWYKYNYVLDMFDRETGAVTDTALTQYKDSRVFTPYLGVVYDVSSQWSAYASAAQTYQSQASYRKGPLPGTPLDPVTGRTFEIGVKGQLLDGRLNTALALYHTKRNGQAVADPAYPYADGDLGSSCCYLDNGRIVSQGVDIEVGGEIASGWRIQAGYTFNDNQNKADNGRYSTVTPKHLFKLWTSYALQGELNGLSIGGGVTAQGSNYRKGTVKSYSSATGRFDGPSVSYEFTEPGRAVVDLFAQYRVSRHYTVAFNVNNVFDKKYYQTVGSSAGGNWYGAPRNFTLSLRADF